MDANLSSFVVLPDDGEAVWSAGCLTMFKATAQQTGGMFALVDEVGPKNSGTPLHRHAEDDESFYVIDGELHFYLGGDEPIPAPANTFAHSPKGQGHAFRVVSETARYLILTTPQHEQFYRAIGVPARTRTLPPDAELDMEIILLACEKFNVELIGPPLGSRVDRSDLGPRYEEPSD